MIEFVNISKSYDGINAVVKALKGLGLRRRKRKDAAHFALEVGRAWCGL